MKKNYLIMMTLFALLGIVFLSCEKEPKYKVQVRADDGGTIEGQSGKYTEGESIVFLAVPNDGYFFAGWNDKNTDNPRTIIVGSDDIYLMASFATTVDLGLTSGTLWATNNIGAYTPMNDGNYFAWGETSTKPKYDWDTYKYGSNHNKLTKYCSNAEYGKTGFTDNLTTLEESDNAATVILGNNWTIPTSTDFQELYDECYWVWTSKYNNHGVLGFIIYKSYDKSKDYQNNKESDHTYSPTTDSHIFLPATGKFVSKQMATGSCFYWSSSLKTDRPSNAFAFQSTGSIVLENSGETRYSGCSIRPVRRK